MTPGGFNQLSTGSFPLTLAWTWLLPRTRRARGGRGLASGRLGGARQTPTMAPMDRTSLELLLTREMPFGKHKGCILADLPGNYLNWFAREGFPPGEIGRLLALMHEIDHNGLKDLLAPLRNRRSHNLMQENPR